MASMQCYKPVEKTCNQVNCPPMTNQGHNSNHCSMDQNKTHHCTNLQSCAPNNGTAMSCHGRTKTRTKKKSLLQRIKDGISGDSSDSSDSESDNEHSGKTRTLKMH
ncbi:hypothetical protein Dsin_007873 [Dipteronia sinensis]|uniref:Uncharacterized protein n=1 Tax=Dipteronia sinensis TaxID=43782 RepID=A0AAE0B102_9ROSI|nr:hypothetical protein Dsin_007873 [Dipteronia sinensis]